MNVLNMFEENNPPDVKPAEITQPDYAFKPNPFWGNEPVTELPQTENTQPVVQPTETVKPELTHEQELQNKLNEYYKLGYNPLAAIIDQNTPQIDPQRQQRLKFAAGVNALGQGLSTIYGGYIGSKGGPILPQENTFTPAALAEYNARLDADKENKYKSAMAKVGLGANIFQQAAAQTEADARIHEAAKERLALQKERSQALLEAAKARSGRNGLSKQDQIDIINAKYDRMDQIAKKHAETMANLEQLRKQNRISQEDFNLNKKKELIRYKAEVETVKTETDNYVEGQGQVKTTKQTGIAPPIDPQKTTIDLSTIPGARIGFGKKK